MNYQKTTPAQLYLGYMGTFNSELGSKNVTLSNGQNNITMTNWAATDDFGNYSLRVYVDGHMLVQWVFVDYHTPISI
jgi:hypothetical protein